MQTGASGADAPAYAYDDNAIQQLPWNEHIRRRPGMYIGKLGDGSHTDDGIYVLIKEVIDNSIDEFNMGVGKRIDITITDEGGGYGARLRTRNPARQSEGGGFGNQYRRQVRRQVFQEVGRP